MLEFFTDTEDGDITFGFYDVDGVSKKIVKGLKDIFGYPFELTEAVDSTFDELPEFLNNTLIISIEHVNEDVIELAKDKNFAVYIIPSK
jgi:hypothetical protein